MIEWAQEPVALGAYTPLEQCSQDCYLKYGAQSANVDADKLIACFAQCDVQNGQLPATVPSGGMTIPGGFQLPTIPAGWTLPANWPLPAGWNLPPGILPPGWTLPTSIIPPGFTLPTSWTLPNDWTMPPGWTLPTPLTLPPGTPLPPAPTPLTCPQGQTWDGVKCVTPGAIVPAPTPTTAAPAKDNTIWYVVGGLAVLGVVVYALMPKGGAVAAKENPYDRGLYFEKEGKNFYRVYYSEYGSPPKILGTVQKVHHDEWKWMSGSEEGYHDTRYQAALMLLPYHHPLNRRRYRSA